MDLVQFRPCSESYLLPLTHVHAHGDLEDKLETDLLSTDDHFELESLVSYKDSATLCKVGETLCLLHTYAGNYSSLVVSIDDSKANEYAYSLHNY